jgi:hypothetical protein
MAETLSTGAVVTPEQENVPKRKRPPDPLVRALGVGAVLAVSVVLIGLATTLLREWKMLRWELGQTELTTVVGYPEIGPVLTFAQRPKDWFHREGNEAVLWSGWVDGEGHRWYRFAFGDIDGTRVIMPEIHHRARAIDFPVVEFDGGTYWRRIPSRAEVVGYTRNGKSSAYPIPVLLKVHVINDVIDAHPYLVTLNRMAPATEAFSVFDAERDGRRMTMASSGYFLEGKPLLYDRATSSLWREDGDSLKSLAGKFKGDRLPRVARPVPVAWESWRGRNPNGRLIVGADRSHGIPSE